MTANPTMRWFCTHGMWATGTGTPREFVAAYLDYHLRDGIAEKIACPTLVCAGTGDQFLAGQPEQLYEHQTSPKTLLEFSAEEGADEHCQTGAERLAFARIFDWLEETFAQPSRK